MKNAIRPFFSALYIRTVDKDMPVEPPWPEQCGVEYLRPVRGGHYDHPCFCVESIHFGKQLVKRLLSFIMG